MQLGYELRLVLVITNTLFVTMALSGVPVSIWVAVFTAQMLLVYYVSHIADEDASPGVSGAIINFIGVVGGIAQVDAALVMAVVGSVAMVYDTLQRERQD